jgi:hypothetical protein
VLAASAAASLAFSGVAQASAPPPETQTVGATTLSSVKLNGETVEPTTQIVVKPGADVKVSANWADNNTSCPSCIDFVSAAYAGSAAPAGCLEFHHFDGQSGTGEVDLGPAPTTRGTVNVVAQFEEVFFCGQFWSQSASTEYPVIARVKVRGPGEGS